MLESIETQRRVGRLAWVMAWAGLVIGQLHALARYRTVDGKGDLDSPTTSFWAKPAGDLLEPLFGWASPDPVYLTYGKLWLPVFAAFTLAAFVVRRRRRPVGVERWAWRIALTCYVAACVAVAAEYWLQWGSGNEALLDGVFVATIPILLLTLLSSTFLGVVLLRRGLRLPAWLLALVVPEAIVVSMFSSMGNMLLPIAFAFGILGRRIARAEAPMAARAAVAA